jgi:molybdate transport system ATP-binding protein
MSFDVDIDKTLRSGGRSFALRVRFATPARRTVIYGPSGAGKSLTLQAIAGLITPDRGRIAFGDDVLFDAAAGIDIPARRRGFGYLFQDYALFPKLNVRQNVAFGLQRGLRNPSAHSGSEAVERCLRAFELLEVAGQRPHELSGGQRQRTALARALVHSPRALLLDEPFSALDPELRERMRAELDELLQRIDLPVLMITHDPDDLGWFGDAALYLRDGAITMRPPALPRRASTRQVPAQHGPALAVAIEDGPAGPAWSA